MCDHLIVLVDSRVQLAGDVDDLLATHHRLTGPRRDVASLPADQEVIAESHTDRQTTLIVRTDGPIPDPAWTVSAAQPRGPRPCLHGAAGRGRPQRTRRAGGAPMTGSPGGSSARRRSRCMPRILVLAIFLAATGRQLLRLTQGDPEARCAGRQRRTGGHLPRQCRCRRPPASHHRCVLGCAPGHCASSRPAHTAWCGTSRSPAPGGSRSSSASSVQRRWPLRRCSAWPSHGGRVRSTGCAEFVGDSGLPLRISPLLFDSRGVAPAGHAAFAFVLGVTVGIWFAARYRPWP